jgi:Hg(II)-responsive transcriptional regulator
MLYHSPMKIGELSKTTGVSIDTVRYYEKRGLIPLPARLASGYRHYTQHDVARLSFIVQAKELGFTLDEIGQLLALRSDGRACVEIRNVAKSKAQAIDLKIQKLSRIRQTLLALSAQCENASDNDPCPILASLEDVAWEKR